MSESYQYTGQVIHIGETQEFNNNFKKALIVLCDPSDRYPQEVPFDVTGKALDYITKLNVGDTVTVKFDLRGRKGTGNYDGRWFGNLNVWRIDVGEASKQVSDVEPDPVPDMPEDSAEQEDMPF